MNHLYLQSGKYFLLIAFVSLFTFNGFAQKDSIYVYKDGSILFKEAVNKFDSITFVENSTKNVLNIHFQNTIVFNRDVSEIDSVNFSSNIKMLPLVTTGNVSEIGVDQATCSGSVLNDGGSSLIAYGFCWSTEAEPTIDDNITTNNDNITGVFSNTISDLTPGTVYYIRAYATNLVGTFYGEQISFTTAEPLSGKNWMSRISSNTYLRNISIPGTHDSGTSTASGATASLSKCQDWDITTQLNNGVRFLDMRFKVNGERLQVYHGIISMNLYHDDFFNVVRQFLADYPSETVILSIRNENDEASSTEKLKFEQILDAEINANSSKWFVGASVPRLSEARGKMVLFRRYDSNKGINMFNNWGDNMTFDVTGGRVQDVYKMSGTSDNSINTKWGHISNLLNGANNDNGSKFFVNFCSASPSTTIFSIEIPQAPKGASDKINPILQTFMDTAAKGSWGWILMDFPTEKLVTDIYMKNIQ